MLYVGDDCAIRSQRGYHFHVGVRTGYCAGGALVGVFRGSGLLRTSCKQSRAGNQKKNQTFFHATSVAKQSGSACTYTRRSRLISCIGFSEVISRLVKKGSTRPLTIRKNGPGMPGPYRYIRPRRRASEPRR